MKKYSLIIWLILIIVAMSAIKIFYKPEENFETRIIPTITPIPTIDLNYPLSEKLPYQGDKFVIEKYIKEKVIEVKTNRTDKTKIKKEIKTWFEENEATTSGIEIDWKQN